MSAVMWDRGILLSWVLLAWPLWSKNVLGILLGTERISLLMPHEGIFPRTNHCSLRKLHVILLFPEVFLLSLVPPRVHSHRPPCATYCCMKPETWTDLLTKSSHSTCKRRVGEDSCPAPKDCIRDFKGQKNSERNGADKRTSACNNHESPGFTAWCPRKSGGPWSGGQNSFLFTSL